MASRVEGFDEAILYHAKNEFLEKGFNEASLRIIAQNAGVSTSTIYTRYSDKETFDIVINRHGAFDENEIWRVLKPKGIFITQQVGAENDRELVELLLNEVPPLPFPPF